MYSVASATAAAANKAHGEELDVKVAAALAGVLKVDAKASATDAALAKLEKVIAGQHTPQPPAKSFRSHRSNVQASSVVMCGR